MACTWLGTKRIILSSYDYFPAEPGLAKAVSLACYVYEAEGAALCCSCRNKTRPGSLGSHALSKNVAVPSGDVLGFIGCACTRKHGTIHVSRCASYFDRSSLEPLDTIQSWANPVRTAPRSRNSRNASSVRWPFPTRCARSDRISPCRAGLLAFEGNFSTVP